VFGFCVGGTIVATALAVLAARGEQPAASLTLLTTLLDFSDTGVLEVFIDEPRCAARQPAGKGGLMPGRDLATTFSSLRPNDLVWNYVQQNYLKGKEPPAFDLLYWNADSTNLPGPMFCWYLRNTYLENSLKRAGQADGGRRAGRPRPDRCAGVHLRLEGRPHRAVEGGVRVDEPAQPKKAQGQPFRAGRVGPHRRRDQPGLQEQAQLLGQRQPAPMAARAKPAGADAWFAGATEHEGQLVAGMGRLSWPSTAARTSRRRAKAGQRATRPIEAGAGPLCEGAGGLSALPLRCNMGACGPDLCFELPGAE
jgi:polyhydroxyalkanoate synthase